MIKVLSKLSGELAAFLKKHGARVQAFLTSLVILKKTGNKPESRVYSLVTLVEKAKIEWDQAKVFFNEAQDPDLIDHAIFAMEAAERKYMYLLKEARKENVVQEDVYYVLNNNMS